MAITDIRKRIDSIDKDIVALLNRRADEAAKIGKEKLKESSEVYDFAREKEVIENAVKSSKGLFPREAVIGVYREIISASRNLEKPMQIAFLGPKTTFTHVAAIRQFGSSASFVPKKSILEVFDEVEKGKYDYGVVPIENSSEGTVTNTLDLFVDSNLSIVGETVLNVKHDLISKYGMEGVKKIYSHPQAFAQCRRWLRENLPKAEMIETVSTAEAAQAATIYHSSAAIASELTAKEYELNILAESIEDNAENKTRFLVIGRASPKKSRKDKTSIVFNVKHEAGSLYGALGILDRHRLNMTKIESRPSRKKLWHYLFYIDFEGFIDDTNVKAALEDIRRHCPFLKILGSYPMEE